MPFIKCLWSVVRQNTLMHNTLRTSIDATVLRMEQSKRVTQFVGSYFCSHEIAEMIMIDLTFIELNRFAGDC